MIAKRVSVALVILMVLALSVSLVLAQGPGGRGGPGGGNGPGGGGPGGRGNPPEGGEDPDPSIRDDCTPVTIDIEPGNEENCINYTSGQWLITVAILTDEVFDATTVDHTTVTFEGASEFHIDWISGEARRHEEDVDGDEDLDLVFHFRLEDAALAPGSTEGTLVGATFEEGTCIEGTDSVQVVTGGCAEP